MEVCPYCKKPFKRLKSHLPHCKKIEAAGREGQKALPSEPAALASGKKTRRPLQDEKEPGMGVGGRCTKITRDTPGRPVQPSPPQEVSVGSAGSSEAGGDIRNPTPGSLRLSGNAVPMAAGGTPKAKPPRGPRAERRGSEPAQMEAALPRGPVEPSLSSPERSYSSALAKNIEAISAHFSVDRTAPSGQKLQGKTPPGAPRGDTHNSTTSLGHASQARASEHISHVPLGVAGSGTQAPAPRPPSHRLRVSLRDTKQGQEALGPGPPLAGGAHGGTGKAGESVAVARVSTSGHSKKDRLGPAGPGLRARDAAPSLSWPRAGPKAAFPSLAALTMEFLPPQKVEACPPRGAPEPRASLLSQLGCGEPMLGAWPQAKTPLGGLLAPQPAPPCAQQSPPTAVAGALGLQWLPELYPAYLGLGMLPGKLQYWDMVALKPHLVSPQGESRSQVPLLGRSWTGLSLEPAGLTPSNLSLTSLLAAVQRGCLKCGTSMRSGVGSVTMLFTGYFVLCCNWSFKHLKLQRWRK